MKTLSQRLLAVKTELARQGISKGKQAPAAMGSFKFRGVEATMNIISKLHCEHGVLVRLKDILEKETSKDGKMIRTEATLLYEFSSSDDKNDVQTTIGLGEGKDSGDKVAGKVHSYGYKNAMYTFYEIPTQSQEVESYDPRMDNEDGDSGTGSAEHDKPEEKPEAKKDNPASKIISIVKGEKDPGYTEDPEQADSDRIDAEQDSQIAEEAEEKAIADIDFDSWTQAECERRLQKLRSDIMQSESHTKNSFIYKEAKRIKARLVDVTGETENEAWKSFNKAGKASHAKLSIPA
tara:strand:- start:646 stop:1521 length:876 start_codon:yes stop_codon:yes gene_type:complete